MKCKRAFSKLMLIFAIFTIIGCSSKKDILSDDTVINEEVVVDNSYPSELFLLTRLFINLQEGNKILYINYDDFDSDGKYEMYALLGREVDFESMPSFGWSASGWDE